MKIRDLELEEDLYETYLKLVKETARLLERSENKRSYVKDIKQGPNNTMEVTVELPFPVDEISLDLHDLSCSCHLHPPCEYCIRKSIEDHENESTSASS